MQCAYVVLYVEDVAACSSFWREKVGMVEKGVKQAGPFSIPQVGFADQDFNIELVPLELMAGNPDGLDLATPSMAFRVDDLQAELERLRSKGVATSDLNEMGGLLSFAFSDNEDRWFAVLAR